MILTGRMELSMQENCTVYLWNCVQEMSGQSTLQPPFQPDTEDQPESFSYDSLSAFCLQVIPFKDDPPVNELLLFGRDHYAFQQAFRKRTQGSTKKLTASGKKDLSDFYSSLNSI